MSNLTPREEILRTALSGELWTFMDEEHHYHIRNNLLKREDWEFIDTFKSPAEAMNHIIVQAEEFGLDIGVSDDLMALFIEGNKEEHGPIHTMLFEIPDGEEDEEEFDYENPNVPLCA